MQVCRLDAGPVSKACIVELLVSTDGHWQMASMPATLWLRMVIVGIAKCYRLYAKGYKQCCNTHSAGLLQLWFCFSFALCLTACSCYAAVLATAAALSAAMFLL